MELLVKIFIFFFVSYVVTLGVHFAYFEADHHKLDKKDEEAPYHKYLKHSHMRWTNNTNRKPRKLPQPYKLQDEQHATLVCEGGDGSEQDLVYWHKPNDFDDKWASPWAPTDGSNKYVVSLFVCLFVCLVCVCDVHLCISTHIH
jgi:hypothetical protein